MFYAKLYNSVAKRSRKATNKKRNGKKKSKYLHYKQRKRTALGNYSTCLNFFFCFSFFYKIYDLDERVTPKKSLLPQEVYKKLTTTIFISPSNLCEHFQFFPFFFGHNRKRNSSSVKKKTQNLLKEKEKGVNGL